MLLLRSRSSRQVMRENYSTRCASDVRETAGRQSGRRRSDAARRRGLAAGGTARAGTEAAALEARGQCSQAGRRGRRFSLAEERQSGDRALETATGGTLARTASCGSDSAINWLGIQHRCRLKIDIHAYLQGRHHASLVHRDHCSVDDAEDAAVAAADARSVRARMWWSCPGRTATFRPPSRGPCRIRSARRPKRAAAREERCAGGSRCWWDRRASRGRNRGISAWWKDCPHHPSPLRSNGEGY